MKFAPKSEKEIAEQGLWEKGEYGFEIVEAAETTSKNGNEMIKLKVAVFNDEGQHQIVFDYLMEAVAHKLRHAAFACGLGEQYENGALEGSDFVGKTGDLKLYVQKDKTGQYPDKNSISDYCVSDDSDTASTAKLKAANAASKAELDDEIPF